MTLRLVDEVEPLSLRAWPARDESRFGQWVVRWSDGYTRRANCANPLGDPNEPLESLLPRIEALYSAAGLPAVFKLTPFSAPGNLEPVLESRGYAREAETEVQVRKLTNEFRREADLAVRSGAEEPWLTLFSRWNEIPEASRPAHERILRAIEPECCFALLHDRDTPVAAGLAVLDEGWVGLFDLVTAPEARRRGFGRRLVRGLLGWAREQGADRCYLQVMNRNRPARNCYASLGFETAYPYWYRVLGEG